MIIFYAFMIDAAGIVCEVGINKIAVVIRIRKGKGKNGREVIGGWIIGIVGLIFGMIFSEGVGLGVIVIEITLRCGSIISRSTFANAVARKHY